MVAVCSRVGSITSAQRFWLVVRADFPYLPQRPRLPVGSPPPIRHPRQPDTDAGPPTSVCGGNHAFEYWRLNTGSAALAGALPHRHSMRRTPPYAQAAVARNAQNGRQATSRPLRKCSRLWIYPADSPPEPATTSQTTRAASPESGYALPPRNTGSSPQQYRPSADGPLTPGMNARARRAFLTVGEPLSRRQPPALWAMPISPA
jgi:hypothetical protein